MKVIAILFVSLFLSGCCIFVREKSTRWDEVYGAVEDSGYPYEADLTRCRQIIKGYSSIKLGTTRERVRELLGLPDKAHPNITKQIGDAGELVAILRGYTFIYLIRASSPAGSGDDQLIFCVFDEAGTLRWTQVVGIPGLQGIGSTRSMGAE